MSQKDLADYVRLQGAIARHDRLSRKHVEAAVLARWEFGMALLNERLDQKQLPRGRLDEVAKATGITKSEVNHRMRLALRYPTAPEVSTAVETYGSWTGVRASLRAAADPGWLDAADEQAAEQEILAEIQEEGLAAGIAPPVSSEAEMVREALLRMGSAANDIADLIKRGPLAPFAVIVAEINPRTIDAQLPKIRAALDAVTAVRAMQKQPPKLDALGPGVLRMDVDGDADDLDRDQRIATARDQTSLPLMLANGGDTDDDDETDQS
jgi:hypothetical protein